MTTGGPRVPRRRLRAARAGGAGPALDRAARPAGRPRWHVPDRAAGPVHAELGTGCRRLAAAAAARGGARARPAATRSRASSCAPSRSSARSRRRSGIIAEYQPPAARQRSRAAAGRDRARRVRGAARRALPALRVRRRRHDPAAPGSCRRRRRIRPRSSTTCAGSCRHGSTSTTSSSPATCEQAIRNYDPCISCATHFLTLSVDRAMTGGPRRRAVGSWSSASATSSARDDGAGPAVLGMPRRDAVPGAASPLVLERRRADQAARGVDRRRDRHRDRRRRRRPRPARHAAPARRDWRPGAQALAGQAAAASSHGLGLGTAVALGQGARPDARPADRARHPGRGLRPGPSALSPAVAAARIGDLAAAVLRRHPRRRRSAPSAHPSG